MWGKLYHERDSQNIFVLILPRVTTFEYKTTEKCVLSMEHKNTATGQTIGMQEGCGKI